MDCLEHRRLKKVFIYLMTALCFHAPVVAQKTIPLYRDSIPNALSTPDEEYIDPASNQLMKVSRPTLTIYLPEKQKANGAAVVICPGGGYGSLVIYREGHDVAKTFTDRGIAAFVLKYRLPDSRTMRNRAIGPLQDAQQAIKLIRQHASEYRVDVTKVGIIGFSAGGHLATTAGLHFDKPVISNPENTNLRPDFMILVYPVVSMLDGTGHKGSTGNLLGAAPSHDLKKYFSTQLQVKATATPAFIAYAADDDGMPASLLLYDALSKNKVQSELHIYAKGGHGFLKYPPVDEWMGRCFNWMKHAGWIK